MYKYWGVLGLVVLTNCFAADLSELDEDLGLMTLYGGEEFISIATGVTQPIAKAPAVASVVTKADIERMGARDIDEVLETIPGLHVARDSTGSNPIYTFRGIYAAFNPQVLMLVNGIPITNLLNGDRNVVWGGMPVNAISRIEVIRGPGSALYGADAFAGVINIVTKEADGTDHFETGVRYGTYNTKEYWASKSGSIGEIRFYGILEAQKSDGYDEKISSDAQSLLDLYTGTNASLAPGSVNMQRENYDGRIELGYKNFVLRAGIQSRNNAGDGVGAAQALSDDNRFSSQRINTDFTYENKEVTENLSLKVQASYLQTTQEVQGNLVLYPEGSTGPFFFPNSIVPMFPGGFPDGVIGSPEVYERHSRFNVSSFYEGFDKHEVGFGAGYYYGDVYKVKESKNYGINPYTLGLILPGDPVVEVTDTPFVFMTEDERENNYVFLQDVWHFANDWELTAGLRYDHYSDFGDTVNPRLALVWSTTRNLTTKLLYGEAFRAPSFSQTRAINNPVFQGNPDLDPEELKSYELAFDYRAGYNLSFNLNVYHYEWEDIIQFVPAAGGSQAQNAGEQTGHGLEFETRWQATERLELIGNLAWQKSEDKNTNTDAGNAPEKQVYLQADWQFIPNWHMNVQANWVMDRNRVTGDPRSDIDDYAIVDLTLRRKSIWENVDVALIVKNLFDKDAREPSQNSDLGPLIYDDLPLAGQSVMAEIRYQY
ncbi:TonB-dependent receptor plug domain-containing protein [Porticoccus sp.]